MKVILYMATTANGYIATEDHDTPWTKDEFAHYANKVKEIGTLIIGKTTFNLMQEEKAFEELGNPFVVVLTSSTENPPMENTLFVNNFLDAIKFLKEKGTEQVLVGGGGKADSAAIETGLVEEIFLDVEPVIFGKGIPLFSVTDTNLNLELIDTKKIGKSGIQLHYKVIK